MERNEIIELQKFLNARGFNVGRADGILGHRTIRALQDYLRRNIDRTVKVDGSWGPHTDRAYRAFKQQAAAMPPSRVARSTPNVRPIRLLMHTASRKKADYWTFLKQAKAVGADYRRHFQADDVREVYVETGKDMVKAIAGCPKGSITSWDVFSHSNFGGIHISEDLAKAVESGWIQRRAHVQMRKSSDRPQTAADAEFVEESMSGLYGGWGAAKAVSYYFNQQMTNGVAHLSDVQFDRFASGCFVEFHGCKTAQPIPQLEAFFDAFVKDVSQELPPESIVIGHTDRSNPNNRMGYRHGRIRVFVEGREVASNLLRQRERFPNSSTPGVNPHVEAYLSSKRTRRGSSQGRAGTRRAR